MRYIYDVKMLAVRRNEISLRKWFGGSAHLGTWNIVCKSESSRSYESRAQSADSSEAFSKPGAFIR